MQNMCCPIYFHIYLVLVDYVLNQYVRVVYPLGCGIGCPGIAGKQQWGKKKSTIQLALIAGASITITRALRLQSITYTVGSLHNLNRKYNDACMGSHWLTWVC